MLTYAGIELGHPSPDLAAWIEASASPSRLWDLIERDWPGPGLAFLDGPLRWPKWPVRINSLWWPNGAARFAVGYYLADQAQVDAIRAVVFADPQTAEPAWLPQDLVAADGLNTQTISLYLLPPRPLQQITQTDDTPSGLYLLTLVDDRFLWPYRSASILINGGATTWLILYSQIALALGITLTVDTIPAAYVSPPQDLATKYRSLPILLDTVGMCVNQRLVRQIDGTCRMWNATEAVAQQVLNLATIGDATLPEPVDPVSGNTFQLGNTT